MSRQFTRQGSKRLYSVEAANHSLSGQELRRKFSDEVRVQGVSMCPDRFSSRHVNSRGVGSV